MLTLKRVEQEIHGYLSVDREGLTPRQISAHQTKVRHLQFVKNYLLENPSKEFIESEIARLEKKLQKIDENFVYWKPPINTDVLNPKKLYEKEMEAPRFKKQIEFLRTILNK